MPTLRPRWLLRVLVALLASGAIVLGLSRLGVGQDTLVVSISGHRVELTEPHWLWLLAITPTFLLVASYTLGDLSTPQLVLSAALRSLLAAGLAIALARPAVAVDSRRVATVFLVDVSHSISDDQLAAAQAWLDEAFRAKGQDDDAAVVTFATRPLVVPLVEPGLSPRIARHATGGAGTDLQAALELAFALYPPGTLPRAVVLSDGNQTHGDLLAEAYKARDFGVRLSFQSFPAGAEREIRVVAVHFPDEVKAGAPFEITGEVWSTLEEEVTLALRQDDFPNGLEPLKKVVLHEGVNRISFRTEAKAAGFSTYRLTLRHADGDTSLANNETVATVPVTGRPHVLYVEGELERSAQAASYLSHALDRENIDVEVRGPRGVPSSAKELQRYDLVLLSDLPATFLGLAQMQALETYVRDDGGGFIMSGGEGSFGSGGYQGTRMEKLLPVRFDGEKELEQPQIALALVIDRSGSMAGEKIEMAKESARATVEVLSPHDLITVIAFDNQPTTIVRLQKASNRLRIATDIARLLPGGGTSIQPALLEASSVLGSANAKVKHVILLSDGQAAYDGIAQLCDEMRANRITVSTVGIGDADRNLLALVAEHGEGRMYLADNATELPKIFMKETKEVQKSSLVEEPIRVTVVRHVELIEGTGVENAPPLLGYVSVKAKPLSEVVLASDRGEPLLARWRVGLGQVVAWTSDVKNRWATEWLTWPGYQRFWAQLVRSTMRHQLHERYDLSARVEDGRALVAVDAVAADDRFVNDLATTLEVVSPADGRVVRSLPMEQTAAGRYQAELPVEAYGTFVLRAVHRREGQIVAESVGSVALPYPAEYLRSTPDEELLRQAAVASGGTAHLAPARAFDAAGETIGGRRELWPFVLFGVACAFLLDVYLRRVRVFGYRTLRL